ncbi:MAG: heavy metal translocating P-type ATPase [Candidatus Hydrogenedentes bacterium]|nr:heavy metal translocating P-type ATPase [Candidatus Hydrogenedentota bacterium]
MRERDPVCGMAVDPSTAKHTHVHDGKTYYFCSGSCKTKFMASPLAYLSPLATLPETSSMAGKDPVCGMTVDPATAKHSHAHNGTTYYFCSESCKKKFAASPDEYLRTVTKKAMPQPTANDTRVYICPMHPEVRQTGPGTCPKCGMALEPEEITAEDTANPELDDMQRRFWISAVLTLPLFVLSMGEMLPGAPLVAIPSNVMGWLQFALATPVVLWGGWPFIQRGWASVVSRHLNMFTLIALGTGVAYVFSVVTLLAPGIVPHGMRGDSHGVPLYFEAAAVIITLVLLGQVLELRARSKTSNAIRSLLSLTPKTGRRIDAQGNETDVPLEQIGVNDTLRVRPGERVPVDGVVLEGSGAIDESMITGESMPVAKRAGDSLTGGTVNGVGSLIMRAEKVGGETVLAHIVRMVSEAQRSRAPIQRLADTVAGYFVPVVMAIAVIAFFAWMLLGPEPRLAYALVSAVSVLIIACPCALGLATPMSIMVGVGRGATAGVLIRNAEALETMERVNTLVVDKTGTLTEGKPRVVDARIQQGFDEREVLAAAAGLEQQSEHPLAQAVILYAKDRGVDAESVEDFAYIPGQGVAGACGGKRIGLGNDLLMTELKSDPEPVAGAVAEMRGKGQTVVYISMGGSVAGVLGIADPIKNTTQQALAELEAAGVHVVMVTGDNRRTAEAVAKTLGIANVEADVLPEAKGEIVKRLQKEGRIVAMAGDGVNDAPALALAHVGIAMGTGTDIAIESAGVTLVQGDLRAIARARKLSRAVMQNIRQNLFLAFAYNAACVPIAAGVLYPITGLTLSPMIAAAAMSLSSVSVIGNALRLRNSEL